MLFLKHTWYSPVLGSSHLLFSFPGILCHIYSQNLFPHFIVFFLFQRCLLPLSTCLHLQLFPYNRFLTVGFRANEYEY